MSEGLLAGRRRLFPMFVLVAVIAVMALLSGCGSGDEDEDDYQSVPRAMVPGGTVDSTAVDAGTPQDMETSYEAGTLSGAGGVSADPGSGEQSIAVVEDEIKPVPVETDKAAAASVTASRPTTPVATEGGAFSLQLGSFTNLDNARKQADRLRAMGYAPVIEDSDLGGQTYHRVMLKNVGDKEKASRLGEHIHTELGIAYLVRRGN